MHTVWMNAWITEREGVWRETKNKNESLGGSQYIFSMTAKKLSLQVAIWGRWVNTIIILC